jgi:hypothetical protein
LLSPWAVIPRCGVNSDCSWLISISMLMYMYMYSTAKAGCIQKHLSHTLKRGRTHHDDRVIFKSLFIWANSHFRG